MAHMHTERSLARKDAKCKISPYTVGIPDEHGTVIRLIRPVFDLEIESLAETIETNSLSGSPDDVEHSPPFSPRCTGVRLQTAPRGHPFSASLTGVHLLTIRPLRVRGRFVSLAINLFRVCSRADVDRIPAVC